VIYDLQIKTPVNELLYYYKIPYLEMDPLPEGFKIIFIISVCDMILLLLLLLLCFKCWTFTELVRYDNTQASKRGTLVDALSS
jgi:hypothetical protein